MQERLFVQEINRFHFLEQQNNKVINLKIYPHIPSVAQFRTLVEWHKGVFSSHFFLLHKPTSRAKTLECILCDVNSSIVLGFF